MKRKRTRWLLAAVFLGVFAHIESLSYWFTSTDTIPLIESSRISSVGEVLSIFARPMMGGTRFTDVALFYRPLASLSYVLDYAVWGLDPTGYHLTNLLLHGCAIALVVLTVIELTGRVDVGGVTGVLFALHPLTVEIVPSVARRHDVLMTIFWLATLWLFVRGRRRGSRRLLVGALGTYVLALGAKEPALLLPGLVVVWVTLDEGILGVENVRVAAGMLRMSLRVVAPFVLVTAVYLTVRVAVLGDIGGYRRDRLLSVADAASLIEKYVLSFAYPNNVIGVALDGVGDHQLLAVAAVFALLAVGLFQWSIRGDRERPGALPVAAVSGGFATLPLAVAVGSQLNVSRVIFGYPTPHSKVVGLLFVGSVVAGGLLASRARNSALSRDIRNALIFFGFWFTFPLGLFLLNGAYTLRSGYLFLVPAMGLVALVLVVAADRVYGRPLRRGAAWLDANIALSVIATLFILSLAVTSPIFHAYNGWRTAGEVNRYTLTELADELKDMPNNETVAVSGVPQNVRSQQRTFPRVKSPGYVRAGTIEAYLRLHDPDNEIVISTNDLITLQRSPTGATFEMTRSDKQIEAEINYRLIPNRSHSRACPRNIDTKDQVLMASSL